VFLQKYFSLLPTVIHYKKASFHLFDGLDTRNDHRRKGRDVTSFFLFHLENTNGCMDLFVTVEIEDVHIC